MAHTLALMTDRRDFLIAALAGGAGASSAGAQDTPRTKSPAFASVDDLGLTPETRADLETFAEPVLREVAYLAELPLDGVDPAFVFVPR